MKPLTVMAWDTATDRCAAALIRAGSPGEMEIMAEPDGGTGPASQILPPLAAAMLRDNGLVPADLDLLVVGRGPGSFTGLRTGLALAKGLALGAGRPALGLGTLEVLAAQILAAQSDPEILAAPVIDARHREVFAALYRRSAGGGPPEAVLSPRPLAPEDLPGIMARAAEGREVRIDGPARPLATAGGEAADGGEPLRVSAAALAAMGAAVFRAAKEAAASLHPPLPLYIRPPDLRPGPPLRGLHAALGS